MKGGGEHERAHPHRGAPGRPPVRGAPAGEARRPLPPPGTALTPAQVLRLQRAIGNRAVGRLLHGGNGASARPGLLQLAPARTAQDRQDWETERGEQLKTHKANQKRVYDLLDGQGPVVDQPRAVPGVTANREQLFANTAEFIKRRCIVVVLTPTLSTRLYPPGKQPATPAAALSGTLFFDEEAAYPLTGAKPEAVEGLDTSEQGLYTRTTGETAHADPSAAPLTMRVFMDRNFSDEVLKTVLIHETQHIADRHGPSQVESKKGSFEEAGMEDVDKTEGDVGNGYRTEFRAYWMGDKGGDATFGDPKKPAANSRSVQWGYVLFWRYVNTGFKNERQEKIFWHMVDSGIYPWVKSNYYFTPAFKKMVDDYAAPAGGNLINSLRIDDLRYELREMAKAVSLLADTFKDEQENNDLEYGWDREESRILSRHKEVMKAAKDLNQLDRAFLATTAAKPFWDFFDGCFAPEIKIHRLERIKQTAQALERSETGS
jgi:hypothetical protein